jgi:hypothetical protein
VIAHPVSPDSREAAQALPSLDASRTRELGACLADCIVRTDELREELDGRARQRMLALLWAAQDTLDDAARPVRGR